MIPHFTVSSLLYSELDFLHFEIYPKHVEKTTGDGLQIPNVLMLNRHWNDALLDFSPTRLKLNAQNNEHKSFLVDLDNENEAEKFNVKNVEHLELEDYTTGLCKAKFYHLKTFRM